ncbi:MAG: BadF/BadG/BcrA/BcrD ATPase family protein [Solirubrobacteraceae bacterium]
MQREPLVTLPPELTEPTVRDDARFLLGVDGGATKTLAAVLDLETRALHLGRAGPSNEDAVGSEAAVGALLGAAQQALDGAGIERDELSAAVLAVAGTDTASVTRHVRAVRPDWLVVNDVVGAWATATGAGPGVAAIAGTGSNVFGVGFDGRSWRAGGWGHLLGDEGSGYWLGIESIRAALHDRDASGPPTELGRAATQFFAVPTIDALASLVYSKPLTKGEIAAFAIETATLAEQGDKVACELFHRGAIELGEQIVAVITQTGLQGAFPIGLIGSAYKAGEVFLAPLRRRVMEAAPDVEMSIVEMAPVGGSLLLAAKAVGQERQLEPARLAELIDASVAG